MARLVRGRGKKGAGQEGEGFPLVRKEIAVSTLQCDKLPALPQMVIERGVKLHMVHMFLQHADSFYIAH
jgi:hypothetical protein